MPIHKHIILVVKSMICILLTLLVLVHSRTGQYPDCDIRCQFDGECDVFSVIA